MSLFVFALVNLIIINVNSIQNVSHTDYADAANSTYFYTFYNGGDGTYQINGYSPTAKGTYPLFIWTTGTYMNAWESDSWTITKYMASHGLVSASLWYANALYPTNCAEFESKAKSIWDGSNKDSAISVLCARDNVDCSKGILVMGFSQGSQLTSMASNYAGQYADYIKAFYEMGGGDVVYPGTVNMVSYPCLKYDALKMDHEKIRSISKGFH